MAIKQARLGQTKVQANRLLPFLWLAFFSTFTGLSQSFEGTMTVRVTGMTVQDINYVYKGEKIRMDMDLPGGIHTETIYDLKNKVIRVVRHDAKKYVDFDLNQMQLPVSDTGSVTISKTGRRETILGYECEEMILWQGGQKYELWATRGLGRFVAVNLTQQPDSKLNRLEELTNQGYYPLRTKTTIPPGNEEARMEVVKVEKKKISDDLFSVPAGYEHMRIPSSWK